MKPTSQKPGSTNQNITASQTDDIDRKKPVKKTIKVSSHIPPADKPNVEPQQLLDQIQSGHTNSPKETVDYCKKLNSVLLTEGITHDERLVTTLPDTKPLATSSSKVQDEDEDEEFFDAQEYIEEKSVYVDPEPEETKLPEKSRLSKLMGDPYQKLMNYIAGKITVKGLHGLKGDDLNLILVAMNKVHTSGTPQLVKLNKLTLAKLGETYNISDAKVVLKEISTPDPEKGYGKIRIRLSITGDAKYPSQDSKDVINGHIELDNIQLDLDFKHGQVIEQLLKSANIVKTAGKLLGSIAYAKMPSWQTAQNWLTWSYKKEDTSNDATLSSLLKPTAVEIRHIDVATTLQSTEHPELHANFTLKNDALSYSFDGKPTYGCCKGTQLSISGEHCAKLMPFNLTKSLAEAFPFFNHDHTSVSIKAPELTFKNSTDNGGILIPQIGVETEGDIGIKNGKVEDMRIGFAHQSSGSMIAAIRAKDISIDQLNLPAGSLNINVNESGSAHLKGVNATFIHSPSSNSDENLTKQEGQNLIHSVRGAVRFNVANDTPTTALTSETSVPGHKLFTLSATTAELDFKGDVNFDGTINQFGLMLEAEKNKLQLHAPEITCNKAKLGASDSEESITMPQEITGTVKDIGLTVPSEKEDALLELELAEAHLDLNGPIEAKDTHMDKVRLIVRTPENMNFKVDAQVSNINSGSAKIKALERNVEFTGDDLHINTDIYLRELTESEKIVTDQLQQAPETKIKQTKTKINAEQIRGNILAEKSVDGSAQPNSVFESCHINKPVIHINTHEQKDKLGTDLSHVIIGTASAATVEATGHPGLKQLSENDQHLVAVCQNISNKLPDFKELMDHELKKHNLQLENNTSTQTVKTQLTATSPSASFSKHDNTINADVGAPKINLAIEEDSLQISAKMDEVKAQHNSRDGTSKLVIDHVDINEVTKAGSLKILPVPGESSVGSINQIKIRQQKKNDEDKVLEVHIGSAAAKTDIEHKTTNTTVPMEVSIHNADITKVDYKTGSDIHANISEAGVTISNKSEEDKINTTANTKQVAIALNLRADEKKFAIYADNTNLHTTGLLSTDAELKNMGVSVESSPEGVKVCPHIDKEQSNIHFDNFTPLITFLEKQKADTCKDKPPVNLSLMTDFERGDELSGSVSASCDGNIGDLCAYIQPKTDNRRTKLFFSFFKFVCAKINFKISLDKAPITKGTISLLKLIEHSDIKISFKGHFSWIFAPLVAMGRLIIPSVINKQLQLLSKSDLIDTNGFVSISELMAKNYVFFSEQNDMKEIAVPVAASHIRTAYNTIKFHQKIPENWDEELFITGIISELERIYGEDEALQKTFLNVASLYLNYTGVPTTAEAFENIFEFLRQMEQMQKMSESNTDQNKPYQHLKALIEKEDQIV